MPYYSELGIYTPSSSYSSPLLKGPYSTHSSILASNILPPSSNQFARGNFRGYKPHLTTISETNFGAPLRRVSSPKVIYHSSPKVRVPRPIKINTADIDVSINRFKRTPPKNREPQSPKNDAPPTTPPPVEKEAKPNTEIRRDRATIRLQTIHKDTLEKEIGEIKSWRDNFKPDELVVEAKRRKKTPGELLKEKFLIRSKSKENVPLPPAPNIPRRVSVRKSPSFKDICNEITSDKAVEDLNPGQPLAVRRRQSRQLSHEDVIKEIQRSSSTLSVEEVQLLDALLQAENEVGLFDEPPEIDEEPKKIRKRRGTKKKVVEDEEAAAEKSSLKKPLKLSASSSEIPEAATSRLRKESSVKDMVKDISQVEIEMIPTKQRQIITGYIGSIDEKAREPNLKAVVGDSEVQESPKPEKKKEKKFRFNVTVEEFPVKKTIHVPKFILTENDFGRIPIPARQKPVITSILKKREMTCSGEDSGNGLVKEPKVKVKEMVEDVDIKPKLLKSMSEMQVKNKEEKEGLKRSESMHSNFTVTVNRTGGDAEGVHFSGSPQGSGKLKIVLIESSTEVPGKTEKYNIPTSNEHKKDVDKTEKMLKSTKQSLKSDTFLCKADLGKRKDPPVWVRNRKEDLGEAEKAEAPPSIEEIKMPPTAAVEQSNAATIQVVEEHKRDTLTPVEEKNVPFLEPVKESNVALSPLDDEHKVEPPIPVEEKPPAPIETSKQLQLKEEISKGNVWESKAEEKYEPPIPVEEEPSAAIEISNQLQSEEEIAKENFWESKNEERYEPPKLGKLKLELKDPKAILKEIQDSRANLGDQPETPEEYEKRMMSKRSLIQKANKSDPDLSIFEPPTPPTPQPEKQPSPEPSFVPLQSNRLSQWMHPWKKPEHLEEPSVEIYAKPKFIRARHIPRRWRKNASESEDSTTTATTSEDESESDDEDEDETEDEEEPGVDEEQNKAGASMSSDDSGFDSGRAKFKGSIDNRDSPGNTLTPATNPAFALDFSDLPEEVCQSSTYLSFQKSGRITPPATTIPRFRKYCVDDFNFLKVLGKGSFGKVLLAELKGTEYYYAIKCLKKDVVLEDDDVECTLIERKVLALGTKHPYLCHLLCTFQTESHLFFVMEYLNGGDLMFHIQAERRFSESRARFYGAEIVSGLKFLHNKGIVYRDLKLDNILLDFDGHVRIADFGMCKLQIFLDRMADTFCGTPDYMAPEIIKGQHYNQCVDWWSFGVLLYEMLLGQSPFSGGDEDELFWSICNEKPVIPRFLSAEAGSVLMQFLEKDANKRLGNRFSPHGDIQDHPFFKPIDWPALEARQLESPFKPNLQHPLDTQYFDKTFTTEKAKLTPIETSILQSMDQTQFQGFSYTNPNATDK